MERTIVGITDSGFEPMFLTYGLGHSFGDVVVPHFYGNVQRNIAKRERFENFYLDPNLAEILRPVIFNNNFEEYFKSNLEKHDNVEKELKDYLRSFEAVSLDDRIKTFELPDIEINVGSMLSYKPESGYYVYPAVQSDLLKFLPEMYEDLNSPLPFELSDINELAAIARKTEESYRIVFIPEINSFSYTATSKLRNEVSTPPLKRRVENNMDIPRSIYVNISGHETRAEDIIEAAKKVKMNVYSPQEQTNTHGNKGPPSLIFNRNVKAVIARVGWGTLWMCQIAEKPIITPEYEIGDHPEVYHNNETVKELGLGAVYKEFDSTLLRNALRKPHTIKKVNDKILKKFGTLEGLDFVEETIRNDLV